MAAAYLLAIDQGTTSTRAAIFNERGQCLGTIRDPCGLVRHRVHAAHAGRIVFLRTFARVRAGDPVCTVLEMAL